MQTNELINFLAAGEFTDEVAYNLLTADIYEVTAPGQVDRSQGTINYFESKVRGVLLPAIRAAKNGGTIPAGDVPATIAPENVSGAPVPDDRQEAGSNGLNRVSGPPET